MADPVEIEINVDGSDAQQEFEDLGIAFQQVSEETKKLEAALKALTKAGGDNADAIEEARRKLIRSQQAQREATVAVRDSASAANAALSKLEALGSTIGQVGTVLSRVSPEMARLGTVIGTVSAQLPALTGSLGPVAQGIAAVTIAVDVGTQAWGAWTGETERAGRAADATKRQITDLANSLTQLHERQQAIAGAGPIAALEERFQEADRRAISLREVLDTERTRAEERRSAAADRINELRQEQLRAIEANPANAGLIRHAGTQAREIAELTRTVQQANNRVRNLAEETRRQREVTDEAEDALARARDRPVGFGELEAPDSGRGGGGGPSAAFRRQAEEQRIIAAELSEFQAGLDREEAQRQRDLQGEIAEAAAVQATAAQQQAAVEAQLFAQRMAHVERIDQARQEAHEKQIRLLEEAKAAELAAAEQLQSDLQGTLGPIVTSTSQALSNIIAGAQSAEEAFQGLLASFLEMIAQQAALEAVKEFAAAIGSFASQDFASGALHLASGAAWVGVAALAGGASAAVAPAAPAAAAPEAGRDTETRGDRGTIVYNFHAPIVATDGSSDRAEAGRQIGELVGEGDNRFGRAS